MSRRIQIASLIIGFPVAAVVIALLLRSEPGREERRASIPAHASLASYVGEWCLGTGDEFCTIELASDGGGVLTLPREDVFHFTPEDVRFEGDTLVFTRRANRDSTARTMLQRLSTVWWLEPGADGVSLTYEYRSMRGGDRASGVLTSCGG